jgi:hypothetical protein
VLPYRGLSDCEFRLRVAFSSQSAGAQHVSMGSAHGSVVKLRDKLMTGALSEGCDGLPLALAAVRSDIGGA